MTTEAKADLTTFRTPNPACPACQLKRMHKLEEWQVYHPQAGQGIRVERKVAG
jgi:hypothetical protein